MADRPRILFVDDEQEFLEYMTKRLTKRELVVRSFSNAVTALEETADEKFDVALLDLKMPDLDGEEMLDRLKARDPNIEVIILTGHGNIESAARATRHGAYEYLQKPADFDDLVTALNKAWAKRLKTLRAHHAERVAALMDQAVGMSPTEILDELKKIDEED